MTVRAVLVDLYDTLVWSEWPTLRAMFERRLGVEESELVRAFVKTRAARSVGTYRDVSGDMSAMLREAGVADDPTVVAELIELERSFLEEGVHLFEDSLPFLRELRARDVRTAVVSNCSHSTRPIVERLKLEDEGDAVVLSFEVRVAKPDPGIYLEALGRVTAEASESLFLDDQARYCDGAVALGMRAIRIDRGGRHVDQEAGAVGDHPTVAGLREVLDLL